MSSFKTALTFIIGIAVGSGGMFAYKSQTMEMAGMPAKVDHSAMGHDATAENSPNASDAAYKIAMDKMMAEMMVPYTGNADVDFAAGMIPHHQGAIDMAKVVLQFGKDPDIRKLAEAVVAAQESEISFMQNWLKANAK